MRRVILPVLVVLVLAGAGCAKKKKKDKLKTSIKPKGGTYFPGTQVDVTISANRQNVTVYYRIAGGSWTSGDAPVSFQVTGNDGDNIDVDWYAEQKDPTTGDVVATDASEQNPHSVTFYFRDNPPTVSIRPSSGDYSQRMTITISASDDDKSGTLTLYWQTSDDGQNWSAEESKSGTGSVSTTVDWSQGYEFHVKARAVDSTGHQAGPVQCDYYLKFDFQGMCQELLNLINQERQNQGANPLQWHSAMASACQDHAKQSYIAGTDGQPMTPGADGKILWDDGSGTPYRFDQNQYQINIFGFGLKNPDLDSAQKVVDYLKQWGQGIWNKMMDPQYEYFGAGCYFDPKGSNNNWYWVIMLGYK